MTTTRGSAWAWFDRIVATAPQRDSNPWQREEVGVRFEPDYDTLRLLLGDVVMSSWATGPELMISTKRMDSSFGKNAANRVEESYGDAKNLRSRHPEAALGFLYGLGANALETEPEIARWLIDLLGKLGRESDAYDAVGLIIPHIPAAPDATSEEDPAGPLEAGASEAPVANPGDEDTADDLDLTTLPQVTLHQGAVPGELDPGRFFATLCGLVLDRTPINFHREARARRRSAM